MKFLFSVVPERSWVHFSNKNSSEKDYKHVEIASFVNADSKYVIGFKSIGSFHDPNLLEGLVENAENENIERKNGKTSKSRM
jgi:hypothetical protein